MTSGFQWSGMEKNVLAQASVIALYDIDTNLPWSFLVSLSIEPFLREEVASTNLYAHEKLKK